MPRKNRSVGLAGLLKDFRAVTDRAPLDSVRGVRDPAGMTGAELRAIREDRFGLTQQEMARLLGMGRHAYSRIEARASLARRDLLAVIGLLVLSGISLAELGLEG